MLLTPTATPEVEQWCNDADRFQFAVCVYPAYVRQAAELLWGKIPKSVQWLVSNWCYNISSEAVWTRCSGKMERRNYVVINLGWLKVENRGTARELAEIVRKPDKQWRYFETTLLTDAEKRLAGIMYGWCGVAFLKTSTGWKGATVADVRLLKK